CFMNASASKLGTASCFPGNRARAIVGVGMHACSWVSLVGFAVACAIACGSDDEESSGKPNESEPTPAPGVCKRICCADTDCASGESCNVFESEAGALGACSGTGSSGQWGGGAMPAGCWT